MDAVDVVIIGAGVAGLAAAETLRRQGRTCCVLEAAAWVGGRARTIQVAGAPFDLGATWLHDAARNPLTAAALHNTIRSSRIPLGADGLDVRLAHKTGSLAGVAHDVAVLDSPGGRLSLAFLTEDQHDTLVSGYEMGICTRGLLQAWGLAVRRSRSLA